MNRIKEICKKKATFTRKWKECGALKGNPIINGHEYDGYLIIANQVASEILKDLEKKDQYTIPNNCPVEYVDQKTLPLEISREEYIKLKKKWLGDKDE